MTMLDGDPAGDYCFFSAGNSDDLAYGWHVHRAPYAEGHLGPYGTRAAAIAQREAYVRMKSVQPDTRAEHLMFGHDIAQRKAQGRFTSSEPHIEQRDPLGDALAESEKPLPAWTRDQAPRAYTRSGMPLSADDQRHIDAAVFGVIPNTWSLYGPGDAVLIAVFFFVLGVLVGWSV